MTTLIHRRSLVLLLLAMPGCRRASAGETQGEGPPFAANTGHAALQEVADDWAASYRFVGGQAERDALGASIDSVVSDMNFFVRDIARGRLAKANPIPSRLTIGRSGDVIAIAFDERRYEAPLDGSQTRVEGITGDMLRYHVTVSEDRVQQVFVGEEGGRHNAIRRRGRDGLTVHVKVTSGRLPKPLQYQLSFRRE